jgi:hypothetical protein
MTGSPLEYSRALSGDRYNNVDWHEESDRHRYEQMRGTNARPKKKTPAELREISDQFRRAANEALTEALKIEREESELADEYGPRLK